MAADIMGIIAAIAPGVIVGIATTSVGAAWARGARDQARVESLAEFRGMVCSELAQMQKLLERLDVKLDQVPCKFECQFAKGVHHEQR